MLTAVPCMAAKIEVRWFSWACDISEDNSSQLLLSCPNGPNLRIGITARIPVRSSVVRVIFLRASCEPDSARMLRVWSGLVWSGLLWSGLVSGLVWSLVSGLVWSLSIVCCCSVCQVCSIPRLQEPSSEGERRRAVSPFRQRSWLWRCLCGCLQLKRHRRWRSGGRTGEIAWPRTAAGSVLRRVRTRCRIAASRPPPVPGG